MMMKKIIIKKNILIFFILFSIGTTTIKDYGYAWDDELMRLTGFVNLKYISKFFNPEIEKKYKRSEKIPDLENWRDKTYGSFFEVFLAVVEVGTGKITNEKISDNFKNIYYQRCLIIFLFIFITYLIFFKIAKNEFGNTNAIIALLLIFSYPRFFAEMHYNSKDLVLAGFAIISIYFALKSFNEKYILNHVVFSLVAAIGSTIRLSFISILITYIIILLLDNKKNLSNKIKIITLSLIIFLFSFYLFHPLLWENPIVGIKEIFNHMINHTWNGNVLYLGKTYHNTATPWHYQIIWILVTFPIIYTISLAISFFYFIVLFSKKKIVKFVNENKFYCLNASVVIGTIIGTIFFQKNDYNGWRHIYFIFPSIILILCSNFFFFKKLYLKIFKIFLVISIINNFIWIYINHPHQYTYFNFLIKNAKNKFDLDWWGLSNKESIEFLLKKYSHKDKIKVWAASGTSLEATRKKLLSKKDQEKFQVVSQEKDADFVITNYINNSFDYGNKYKKVYEIISGKNVINSVYKKK